MEGLLALLACIGALALVAIVRAVCRRQRQAPLPSSASSAPPETLRHDQERWVQVTFLADTPWGNAGETLVGRLTEQADRQRVVLVDSGCATPVAIPEPSPYVRVEQCPVPLSADHARTKRKNG
jgi:hypothetical protein